eukprot:12086044-Alexandrium_andersonii.AAC.1
MSNCPPGGSTGSAGPATAMMRSGLTCQPRASRVAVPTSLNQRDVGWPPVAFPRAASLWSRQHSV